MVSKAEPTKVLNYWIANDYLDVAIFLITSLDNLRNRGNLLKRDLDELKRKLKEIDEKIVQNPDVAVPENLEISQLFKDFHYTELEVIQRVNILIELLAVYYFVMRKNLRELPKAIGSRDIRPRELHKEFNYFVRQDMKDVWRNFKYPDVTHFVELSSKEQNTLGKILTKSAVSTLKKFREVYEFQRNFRIVYNKYKHTLSESTGMFGINKEKLIVQSHIFVRHKEEEKTSSGKVETKYHTYLIPVSLGIIEYFDKIARNTWTLLEFLIGNTLYFLANKEKDFIPKRLFVESEEDKNDLIQICNKVTTYAIPNIRGRIKAKAPDQQTMEQINKKIKTNYIYRMDKDIFNIETLLKEGVTISKD